MPRALKVFRTAIGFHDAYVAATSRKAALDAWGSATDLFAVGLAEQVTDDALVEEALAHPGQVFKRVRGTPAEHLAAAKAPIPKAKRPVKTEAKAASGPPPPRHEPPPKPSRTEIEQAEAALDKVLVRQKHETADFERREAALRQERDRLRSAHEQQRILAEDQLRAARKRHDEAMQLWLELER